MTSRLLFGALNFQNIPAAGGNMETVSGAAYAIPVQKYQATGDVTGTVTVPNHDNHAHIITALGSNDLTASTAMSAIINQSNTINLTGSGTITGGLTTYNGTIDAATVNNLGDLTDVTGTRTQATSGQGATDFNGGDGSGGVFYVRTNGTNNFEGGAGANQQRARGTSFRYTVVDSDDTIQVVFDTSDGGGQSGGGTTGTINGITYNGMDGTQNGNPVVVATFRGPASGVGGALAAGFHLDVVCNVDTGGSVNTTRRSRVQRYNYAVQNRRTDGLSVVLTSPLSVTLTAASNGQGQTSSNYATNVTRTSDTTAITGTFSWPSQAQFGTGSTTRGVTLTRSDGGFQPLSVQTVGTASSVGSWFTSGSGPEREGFEAITFDANTSFARLQWGRTQGSNTWEVRDPIGTVIDSGTGNQELLYRGPAWVSGDSGLGRSAAQVAAAPQLTANARLTIAYSGNASSRGTNVGRGTRAVPAQLYNYTASNTNAFQITLSGGVSGGTVLPANSSNQGVATGITEASGTIGWNTQRPGGTTLNTYNIANSSGKIIYIGGVALANGANRDVLSGSSNSSETFTFTQRQDALSGNFDTSQFTGTLVNE